MAKQSKMQKIENLDDLVFEHRKKPEFKLPAIDDSSWMPMTSVATYNTDSTINITYTPTTQAASRFIYNSATNTWVRKEM